MILDCLAYFPQRVRIWLGMKLVASVLILVLLGCLAAAVTMDETECASSEVRRLPRASTSHNSILRH